jgi:outer membrane protein assembly factor BamE (lipoprotein component of BamABCDE complex)
MPKAVNKLAIILWVFCSMCALGLILLSLEFNRLPVDREKIDRLTKNMSRQDVESLLGHPANIYDVDRKWAYSRLLSWSIVYVYFDKDGQFERVEIDY